MRPTKPREVCTIVLSALCLWSALNAAEVPSADTQSVESLIRRATFIFAGTIVRLNATTMPEVPASESMAVVRVDDIIEASGAPADLKGREITVQLLPSGASKQGEKRTFFTRGWLLGDSMAVIEVGRAAESIDAKQVRDQLSGTHQKMDDDVLLADMASAEAIVVGTVASVKAANIRHIGSEHDPDWYEAEINVESVEKGPATLHTATVLFPHSDDVMWHSAPKFKAGQQGIWLLHRGQEKLPGIGDQYTALKPVNFQSRERLERIRSLRKPVV